MPEEGSFTVVVSFRRGPSLTIKPRLKEDSWLTTGWWKRPFCGESLLRQGVLATGGGGSMEKRGTAPWWWWQPDERHSGIWSRPSRGLIAPYWGQGADSPLIGGGIGGGGGQWHSSLSHAKPEASSLQLLAERGGERGWRERGRGRITEKVDGGVFVDA